MTPMMIKKVVMRPLVIDNSTICATATAPGTGGIAVVRVSGPEANNILRKLCKFLPQHLESHRVYYGWLCAIDSGTSIDEVLVTYFEKGRSFTGEMTFEISCHGSEIICEEILRNLCLAGARMAERGEFTFRSFMNGRIDLIQAESVLDLIESSSSRAAQLALRQLQGDVSKNLRSVLDRMTWILAHLEANIDFASEDIEVASENVLLEKAEELYIEIQKIVSTYQAGSVIRDGFQVALVGEPNVGKSSLLNGLIGEEKAIVTNVPGTTRDFVEAQISLDGIKVSLVDTAGLRLTDDPVEKIGVHRTIEKLQDVDLVLFVVDQSSGGSGIGPEFLDQIPWAKVIMVGNKADLSRTRKSVGQNPSIYIEVSGLTGMGLKELKDVLSSKVKEVTSSGLSNDSTMLSNVRHYEGLIQTMNSLKETKQLIKEGASPDFVALELQSGLQAVHEILGITYDDQVMDRVFKEFCLGK